MYIGWWVLPIAWRNVKLPDSREVWSNFFHQTHCSFHTKDWTFAFWLVDLLAHELPKGQSAALMWFCPLKLLHVPTYFIQRNGFEYILKFTLYLNDWPTLKLLKYWASKRRGKKVVAIILLSFPYFYYTPPLKRLGWLTWRTKTTYHSSQVIFSQTCIKKRRNIEKVSTFCAKDNSLRFLRVSYHTYTT